MARKRILIVKLSSLGDIFHALPTVHALKVGLDADVDWVTQPEYAELLACFPDVATAISYPRRDFLAGIRTFIRALRARDYDMVIDLQGLLKSAIAAKLARSRRVIGPSFHREGAHLLYDAVAGPRDKERHAVEENLDVVHYLGLAREPVQFPVQFPVRKTDQASLRIAMVPVSRGAHKNWPVENFTETVRRLRRETSAVLYLFGSQADRAVCESIRVAADAGSSGSRVENLAGQTSLVEMGSWFATMDLVVANDSGPIHMAAALGVPVLAVFGPTDPRRTGPYGTVHRVVTADIACRPCCRKECKQGVPVCLAKVTPDKVVSMAIEMMGAKIA